MNRILLLHQEGALRSYFPDSIIVRRGEQEITWIHNVSPSPISGTYKLKLHYVPSQSIKVYVAEPKLKLAAGKYLLPHVYSTPKQRLCLYDPEGSEWNPAMFYVKSIIPWAVEWLYHYEIWVGTGKWHGGGKDHETAAEAKPTKSFRTLLM